MRSLERIARRTYYSSTNDPNKQTIGSEQTQSAALFKKKKNFIKNTKTKQNVLRVQKF